MLLTIDNSVYSVATTPNDDLLIGNGASSAYLFDGNDGSLLLTINNPTPAVGDSFGYSVATTPNGDLLIGDVNDDTGSEDAGSVYLFEGILASTPAPIITLLVADDPDDLDDIYSANDTITILFDSDTNTPGGMGVQNKTAINDLYNFTESLGETYTGVWNTTDTFVITITNATGASPPIINSTTVTPAGITLILSSDETSSASTASSSPLEGDFGVYTQSSGALESGSHWWFETPSIPIGTQTIVINATFTNQDNFGRNLSFSASPYQLWAYGSDRTFMLIPEEVITILQKPTESVDYNDTFHYEIEIDISTLPDPVTLAFRVVTIEGGTMKPNSVPNLDRNDEVTFFG